MVIWQVVGARLAETLSGDRRQGAARGVGGGARQLEQQLEEQAASLERLRAARNSTAQQRMAAIEAERTACSKSAAKRRSSTIKCADLVTQCSFTISNARFGVIFCSWEGHTIMFQRSICLVRLAPMPLV